MKRLPQSSHKAWKRRVTQLGISSVMVFQGVSYLEQIDEAIEQCHSILIIISTDSVGSWQIDKEVERAHAVCEHFMQLFRRGSHVFPMSNYLIWIESGCGVSPSFLFRINERVHSTNLFIHCTWAVLNYCLAVLSGSYITGFPKDHYLLHVSPETRVVAPCCIFSEKLEPINCRAFLEPLSCRECV